MNRFIILCQLEAYQSKKWLGQSIHRERLNLAALLGVQ